jgi:hypothetical protein
MTAESVGAILQPGSLERVTENVDGHSQSKIYVPGRAKNFWYFFVCLLPIVLTTSPEIFVATSGRKSTQAVLWLNLKHITQRSILRFYKYVSPWTTDLHVHRSFQPIASAGYLCTATTSET